MGAGNGGWQSAWQYDAETTIQQRLSGIVSAPSYESYLQLNVLRIGTKFRGNSFPFERDGTLRDKSSFASRWTVVLTPVL